MDFDLFLWRLFTPHDLKFWSKISNEMINTLFNSNMVVCLVVDASPVAAKLNRSFRETAYSAQWWSGLLVMEKFHHNILKVSNLQPVTESAFIISLFSLLPQQTPVEFSLLLMWTPRYLYSTTSKGTFWSRSHSLWSYSYSEADESSQAMPQNHPLVLSTPHSASKIKPLHTDQSISVGA